ncbi:hypothetical protein MUB04_15825 [Acinetobacter indicus]|uniref:hypothetical protein n=1 Tax=Acinetobacter TaxID=469 RepID=UPI0015D2C3CD|nr:MULTISPECIES: hypothetical protein [Acinetobacter]MCP0918007.1 hypothetical protein [Acinetobacter indicus]
MNANLQDQLNKLTTPTSHHHCFNIHESKWVELPHNDFLDTDFYLPPLSLSEKGYRSVNLLVLTTRSTVYGPTLDACVGYVKVPMDSQEDEYQYSLEWHSDDGETVIGWMPIPVFHVDEETTITQDASRDDGFYFHYSA